AELFFSTSFAVNFAGETTRPEPCSTRSMTFMSVTSPVTIPALTLIAVGVTVYVLSSTTAAVAAGCGEGPRIIHTTTAATAAASPHRHTVITAFSSPALSVGQNLR